MTTGASDSANRRATAYLLSTMSGRGIVFGGLLLAAATLSKGEYARFALAYQIGLFTSYLFAPPLVVAGFRLRAAHGASALGHRVAAGAVVGAVAAGSLAYALVPERDAAVVLAVAAYGAAATVAAIMMSQASAESLTISFGRWAARGAILFPLAVALEPDVTVALAAAAGAISVAPLAMARRLLSAEAVVTRPALGRPPASIFIWNLAYNAAPVVLLGLASHSLSGAEADRVALALTLVQAALVVPMQYAFAVQPQLVEDTRAETRSQFARTQMWLSLAFTLLALGGAGVCARIELLDWGTVGVMATSTVALGFGLTGGYSIQLARGAGPRFVAAPIVFLATLAVCGAVSTAADGDVQLASAWAIAAAAGALAQAVNESWAHVGRPLLVGLGAAGICLAAGLVEPLLATAVALAMLVAGRRYLAHALADARATVGVHR